MRKSEIRLSDRFRYRFDNLMARGTVSQIIGLLLLMIFICTLAILIIQVFGLAPEGDDGLTSSVQAIWENAFDPANLVFSTGSWVYVLIMFLIALTGIFVLSALIGILSAGLDSKLEELKRGRSFVAENDHTVILGSSSKVYSIISELVIANENVRNPCITILADEDPADLLDEIQNRVGDTQNTRIVIRRGDPLDTNDINIVNLNGAKSIIVPAPETGDPDIWVIKVVLAIVNNPHRRTEPYQIIVELSEKKNSEVVKMVGRDEVEIVLTKGLISRLVAQTCRQSGLSLVYTDLFDFGGDEVYFYEEPLLFEKSFGEAQLQYEDSTLIGLFSSDGEIYLNPPAKRVIKPGDRVIAISEDDDTVRVSESGPTSTNNKFFSDPAEVTQPPERTLIIGWNQKIFPIIEELDQYLAAGSELTIIADTKGGKRQIEAIKDNLENQKLTYKKSDTTDREVLDSIGIPDYDQVIVLSYSDELNEQEADANTMLTLLHLRDIADNSECCFRVVSEMLDIRNKELAQATRADDFIVGGNLISLVLAQISENRHLSAIFEQLTSEEGAEIYLKPASDYVVLETEVDFYTVLSAAIQRDEIAFGYRKSEYSMDESKNFGVTINPAKSDKVVFHVDDTVVVLSEG